MWACARQSAALGALLVLGACSAPSTPAAQTTSTTSPAAIARLLELDAAVTAWASASTLAQAKTAAETAANLVTGPDVGGYGDLDGDGHTGGANDRGLLPGEQGQPGLVTGPTTSCVESAVLGGSWGDPAARWADLRIRIAQWSPDNNTFPALASHPQRVVGWASLAVASTSLDAAQEFAGHAQLHVAASRAAFENCSS